MTESTLAILIDILPLYCEIIAHINLKCKLVEVDRNDPKWYFSNIF